MKITYDYLEKLVMKKCDENGSSLSYNRELVLSELKEKGIILDYRMVHHQFYENDRVVRCGSLVGFDRLYKVYLKVGE